MRTEKEVTVEKAKERLLQQLLSDIFPRYENLRLSPPWGRGEDSGICLEVADIRKEDADGIEAHLQTSGFHLAGWKDRHRFLRNPDDWYADIIPTGSLFLLKIAKKGPVDRLEVEGILRIILLFLDLESQHLAVLLRFSRSSEYGYSPYTF